MAAMLKQWTPLSYQAHFEYTFECNLLLFLNVTGRIIYAASVRGVGIGSHHHATTTGGVDAVLLVYIHPPHDSFVIDNSDSFELHFVHPDILHVDSTTFHNGTTVSSTKATIDIINAQVFDTAAVCAALTSSRSTQQRRTSPRTRRTKRGSAVRAAAAPPATT